MTGDPTPIRVDQLREKFAHRATGDALEPDDYDDPGLADARREGIDAMRGQRWRAIVPQRFHHAQVSDFDGPLAAKLDGWGHSPAGRNLVVAGPVGAGKSHAAVAAARVSFDRGREVRFLPVVEMFDLLRPGGPEGALYDLADVDVLILDDVGQERPTDWTAERLYALVNRRWMEERPTVATTNLSGGQLADAVGERVFSRLVGSGAVVLKLTGADRRRTPPPLTALRYGVSGTEPEPEEA